MSNPRHSLLWMGIYLAVVAGVCLLLFAPLQAAFMANWGFNSLIMGALLIGIIINARQVLILEPEISWITLFRTGEAGISLAESPRLLKPLARHLHGRRKDRFRLSALSLRTVLDGIRARLDESREISRYMIGLLVFLGLLGTFWGLLGTISSVSSVIAGLDVGNREFAAVFQQLKAGLQQPLTGMGTAFSSSLFGLGGSLVLGFLDILAGHAQNRFFNDLEEWLSGVTQLIDEPGSQPLFEDADNLEQRLSQQMREKQDQRSRSAQEEGPPADDATATARPGAGDD
ncbi:flagellar motor protein MotA [Sedimenticola hydrogenitrophicus]|uniref:flagellar motor protein MotA n=1 Tax=Sedimenticola hydrogenitrophicus TaxID=2967975 RepID=UPI0023B01C7E|nr:flagellar motor protein MotA [Sedimenticola hydrogenitrophicus]